jgi:hypothetical protein
VASISNEFVRGVLVNHAKTTIALIGSGLPLAICTAYLADKLQYLKPIILAIQLPQESSSDDFGFAFPPFSDVIVPVLHSQLARAGLNHIDISTRQNPSGFAFNFSQYGVASAAVTFPQAYTICQLLDANIPSYDKFLGVKPLPSQGFLYAHQHLSAQFRKLSVLRGATYIPCDGVSATLAADNKKILGIETSNKQRIKADFFIDCSRDGFLMQYLQTRSMIPKSTIPSWIMKFRKSAVASTITACSLKFSDSQAVCTGDFNGERYERIYEFGDCGASTSGDYFEESWFGNCVSIGCGFAKIPDLLISMDRLLEKQLGTLSWLLGAGSDVTYSARHYNMLSARHLNEVIDSINLLLNPIPDCLVDLTSNNQRRVALFESSANTIKENNSFVSDSCWSGLLHVTGRKPKNTNAVAAATDPQRILDLTKSLINC